MRLVLQALFLGCAFVLAVWLRLPVAALAGLGLIAAALIASSLSSRSGRDWIERAALAMVWVGSVAAWGGVALGNVELNAFYAIPAGLMAAAVWLGARNTTGPVWTARWNTAAMAWLLCGALTWLGAGYFQNQRGTFYAGLLATLAALALCRLWFALGAAGAQTVNTMILLLIGLPVVDLALRPQSRVAVRPETCRLYYSFDASRGDPAAFARWEEYYTSQFDRLGLEIFVPDPEKFLPFRLRPGSHGTLINSSISINSHGFRGPEFSTSKDGGYRIVVLGESTTFGMTIQPQDKPWPELLEQIIRERLTTKRPVQVINAGVPAYNILGNLHRLAGEILPLKPDMIISYHGANGFSLIDASMLPTLGPVPPVYEERPIKLAADAEHRLQMLLFQKRAERRVQSAPSPASRPLETKYAAAYRQLIDFCRTNGIRLALANFSMAVNQSSDPKVIDFYRGGGARSALGFIRANAVHSAIVSQLAGQNPGVCFIDSHPHLDGEHENYIDVIHFTGEGERQMAENVFAGIRGVLEHDLGADAALNRN
jgi:lysophospholipase L1-like esterase